MIILDQNIRISKHVHFCKQLCVELVSSCINRLSLYMWCKCYRNSTKIPIDMNVRLIIVSVVSRDMNIGLIIVGVVGIHSIRKHLHIILETSFT